MSIADFIQQDLAVRLRAGQDLPAQLTLDSLADHYQVSFTPVRAAVAALIEEGLLSKGSNRRLVACQPELSGHQPAETPEPKEHDAPAKLPELPPDPYQVIADDLVRMSLQGEAVYLREEATAEKYEISRSAVRNILHRLAGEGMLEHIPRRGWRLRPFRQSDMQEFIEVREVLELKALDLARPHLTERDLAAMLEVNVQPASQDDTPKIDESIHRYLIEKADNWYITQFFEQHGRYYRLLFVWEDHDRETALETIRQHREILNALLAKDWRGARKALSYHIRCHHPILSTILPKVIEKARQNDRVQD